MDNNAYLLRCTQTGELALIDAANDADTLLGLIGDSSARHDHHHPPALGPSRRPAGRFSRPTGAATLAHPADAPALPIPVTSLVQQGDKIAVGNAELSVIHLRGHTPGSIALLYGGNGELAETPHLFTGDSLFPGGPGNTDKDPERFNSLMTDLEERVFAELPDATWVYPGHGGDTTLGTERPHLPEWRVRGW